MRLSINFSFTRNRSQHDTMADNIVGKFYISKVCDMILMSYSAQCPVTSDCSKSSKEEKRVWKVTEAFLMASIITQICSCQTGLALLLARLA